MVFKPLFLHWLHYFNYNGFYALVLKVMSCQWKLHIWASKADNTLCNHMQNVPVIITVSLSIMWDLFAWRILELFKAMRIVSQWLSMSYISGQKCCCQDAFSNSWKSWAKTFKKHVGGLSLELCFPCCGSCFSHGNLKWL